jgi:hypothetical protein
VGAIDPVGMTNASASNVRNRNASTKANRIDSIVSRALSFCFGFCFGLGDSLEEESAFDGAFADSDGAIATSPVRLFEHGAL